MSLLFNMLSRLVIIINLKYFHSLKPSSPSVLHLSQHQGLFQWVSCLHQVTKILEFQFPVNIEGWFLLRLTVMISLLSKGLSGIFSNITIQRPQFFGALPSLLYSSHNCTWPLEDHSLDYTDLCWQSSVSTFNTLSRFIIAFLPRSIYLLISWLQSPSAVILESKKRKSVTTSTFFSLYLPWSNGAICHDLRFFFF